MMAYYSYILLMCWTKNKSNISIFKTSGFGSPSSDVKISCFFVTNIAEVLYSYASVIRPSRNITYFHVFTVDSSSSSYTKCTQRASISQNNSFTSCMPFYYTMEFSYEQILCVFFVCAIR